jgi:hypothetical protein
MTRADAIKHFNGIPALARALGISYEAVRQWGPSVPELRQYQLERLTNGALKAEASQSAA